MIDIINASIERGNVNSSSFPAQSARSIDNAYFCVDILFISGRSGTGNRSSCISYRYSNHVAYLV